jgi:Raf kinase inhibitor-like YbhB/YbcL family protein
MRALFAPVALAACLALAGAACRRDPAPLAVRSEVLKEMQPIPLAHVCKASRAAPDPADSQLFGTSPPLTWDAPPAGTEAVAVTMVDPDAEGFVHWAVVLPAGTTSLAAGALPAGAREFDNGFQKPGYGGPCPPPGPAHRYVVTVHALDGQPAAGKDAYATVRAIDKATIARGSITVMHQRAP